MSTRKVRHRSRDLRRKRQRPKPEPVRLSPAEGKLADEAAGELDTPGVDYLRPTGVPRKCVGWCRCAVCRDGS